MGSQISSLKVEKRKIRSELNAVEMNLKESQKQLADALGGADALDVVANGMRRMEEKISAAVRFGHGAFALYKVEAGRMESTRPLCSVVEVKVSGKNRA